DMRSHDPARRLEIEQQATTKPRLAAEPAEQQIGIGDRRSRAAAAVAGRTGRGLGAMWADPQGATIIDPCDRSAAGADRVDVDRRQADGYLIDLGASGGFGLSVSDQADVGAGAADVHGNDIPG